VPPSRQLTTRLNACSIQIQNGMHIYENTPRNLINSPFVYSTLCRGRAHNGARTDRSTDFLFHVEHLRNTVARASGVAPDAQDAPRPRWPSPWSPGRPGLALKISLAGTTHPQSAGTVSRCSTWNIGSDYLGVELSDQSD
jgi:hypothetical protein